MSGASAVWLCAATLMLGLSLQGCQSQDEDYIRASAQCKIVEGGEKNKSSERLRARRQPLNKDANVTNDVAKDLVKKALLEFVNNENFLSGLSGAKQNIPDKMEFDLGGSARDQLDTFGGYCKVDYAVGASVQECSGMQKIDVKISGNDTLLTESVSGGLTATIPMTISAGPITCIGHACASGAACGLKISPAVTVKPTLSISLGIRAVMRVVDGSGENNGKLCFEVASVEAEGGEFTWGSMNVNLSGFRFEIPSSVLQQAWENVPLDEITSEFTDQLSTNFEDALGAMATCFDMPELPGNTQP